MFIIRDILQGWIAGGLVLVFGIFRIVKVLLSLIQLIGAVVVTTAPCLFGNTIGSYILQGMHRFLGGSDDKESSDL